MQQLFSSPFCLSLSNLVDQAADFLCYCADKQQLNFPVYSSAKNKSFAIIHIFIFDVNVVPSFGKCMFCYLVA